MPTISIDFLDHRTTSHEKGSKDYQAMEDIPWDYDYNTDIGSWELGLQENSTYPRSS